MNEAYDIIKQAIDEECEDGDAVATTSIRSNPQVATEIERDFVSVFSIFNCRIVIFRIHVFHLLTVIILLLFTDLLDFTPSRSDHKPLCNSGSAD